MHFFSHLAPAACFMSHFFSFEPWFRSLRIIIQYIETLPKKGHGALNIRRP